MSLKRVLVTGSAGFIGFHMSSLLLQQGATVLGVDNFSDYYDMPSNHTKFSVARVSIDDMDAFGAAW